MPRMARRDPQTEVMGVVFRGVLHLALSESVQEPAFDSRLLLAFDYPKILFHRSRFHCTFSAGVILLKSGSPEASRPAGFAGPPLLP